jgi:hypothetical protein
MSCEYQLNTDLNNIITDFRKLKEVVIISESIMYLYLAMNIVAIICVITFSVLFAGAGASAKVRRKDRELTGRK